MIVFMETPRGPTPNDTISKAIDLYNELNALPSELQREKLPILQALLDKIATDLPEDYIHYMWMHMITVLGIHGYYYSQKEVDLREMNYYHVKKAVQRILKTEAVVKDRKIEIDGEIDFLFIGEPKENKKLGYWALGLRDSNPRSTLIEYIEEAIIESKF